MKSLINSRLRFFCTDSILAGKNLATSSSLSPISIIYLGWSLHLWGIIHVKLHKRVTLTSLSYNSNFVKTHCLINSNISCSHRMEFVGSHECFTWQTWVWQPSMSWWFFCWIFGALKHGSLHWAKFLTKDQVSGLSNCGTDWAFTVLISFCKVQEINGPIVWMAAM